MNAMVQAVERGEHGTTHQDHHDNNDDKEPATGGGADNEEPTVASTTTTTPTTADAGDNSVQGVIFGFVVVYVIVCFSNCHAKIISAKLIIP